MSRKPIVPLLIVVALVTLVAFYLLGDDSPGRSTLGPARPTAAAPEVPAGELEAPRAETPDEPAPPEPVAQTLAPVAVPAPAEEAVRAGVREGSRQWVEGRVVLPEGTPADERLFVLALDRRRTAEGLFGERAISDGAWDEEVEREPLVAFAPVELRERGGIFRLALPVDDERAFLALSGRYVFSRETTEVALPATDLVLGGELGAWITGSLHAPVDADQAERAFEGVRLELGPDLTAGFDSRRLQAGMFTQYTQADGAGRFGFRAVPCDLRHGVHVKHPDLANLIHLGVATEPGEHLELPLTLLRGATLAGRVVDPDGQGIGGALVSARRPGQIGQGIGALCEAGSEPDGHFRLEHVPPGTIELRAELDGHRDGTLRVPEEVFDGQSLTGFELRLDPGNVVRGRVLFADRTPAVGVDVRVAPDFTALAGGMTNASFDPRDGGQGATDAEGEFAIGGLGAGPFVVRATHDPATGDPATGDPATGDPATGEASSGAAPTQRAEVRGVRPADPPLELVLAPALGLIGYVEGPDGTPPTSFTVRAMLMNSGGVMNLGAERRAQTFEDQPEGRFELRNLSAGEWELYATAEGHARSPAQRIALPRAEGAAPPRFVVPLAARVAGQVVDTAGQPVAGASVTLDLPLAQLVQAQQSGGAPRVTADPAGRFELGDLEAGTVSLVASHDAFAASEPVSVELAAGERAQGVVLALRAGGVLTGEVLDDAGEPVPGRMIVVQPMPQTGLQRLANSDERGAFRVEHLEPGSWQVIAMRNVLTGELDMASEEEGQGVAGMLEDMEMEVVDIVDGEQTHVVLGHAAQDPVLLTGRVTHAGRGLAQAVVSVVADPSRGLGGMEIAVADAEGSFELELESRGSLLFTVQHVFGAGQQNSVEFRLEIPEAVEEHHVELEMPAGRVAGRVRGPDGAPLEGCRVTLTVEDGVAYGSFLGGQYVEASTDAEGRYEIPYVREGTYAVAAGGVLLGGMLGGEASGGRVVQADIRVEEGESVDGVDFRLEEPGRLSGVVHGADGRPAAEAAVFVRDEDGHLVERLSLVSTDAAGRFTYDGLAPGRYRISARRGEEVSAESDAVTVRAGEEARAEAFLGTGTVLRIRVVDREERDVRARIRVVDDRGREHSGMLSLAEVTSALGRGFENEEQRVGPIPPGRYEVSAFLEDGRSGKKTVSLSGQGERLVKLRVR